MRLQSNKNSMFSLKLKEKIENLESRYEQSTTLSEKSKLLFLMSEISEYKDIFDPKAKDNRPERKQPEFENLQDEQLYKNSVVFTNHPTYPLGHEATIIILDMKLAIIDGDSKKIDSLTEEFLNVKEVTSKRTTDQSYHVINNAAKIAWKAHDLLSEDSKKFISIEDWLNDADGNPNKTVSALNDSLVNSNKLFKSLLVEDLEKIANSTPVGKKLLEKEISKINDFEISKDKLLDSDKIVKKLNKLKSESTFTMKVDDQLDNLIKKVEFFESFVTKPQMRQEGAIFEKGYQMLAKKFEENDANIQSFKIKINKKGDIVAKNNVREFTVFKAEEYAQQIDADGKPKALERESDSVVIDNIAKLVTLSSHKKLPIKKFIMSEFGGSKEMADALRLFEAVAIDTKQINLFPLYEEIENYSDMKVFSNVLRSAGKDSEKLSENEKLIKNYIDDTGAVRIMFAASDTSKRGGAMAYSKMLHEVKDLSEAIAEYNKDKPKGEKVRLSFYWGSGPDPARGGEINFIRAVKSIVGARGVPLAMSFTHQGQEVVRISDPVSMVSKLDTITQEYLYHSSKKIDPESKFIKDKNSDIWDKFSDIFAVLGNDLKDGYNSSYKKFAEKELTNDNPLLVLTNALAGLANTSDRPSKRKESPQGTPFLEFMRAIGYDHGARIAGFNNTILGQKESLEKFFDKMDKGKEEGFVQELKQLYKNSTTYNEQVNTIGAIVALTDLNYLDKVGSALKDTNLEKFKDVDNFIEKVKSETLAIAKFATISIGDVSADIDRREAYDMLKEKYSGHIKKDLAEKAKDNMLELISSVAKGERDVHDLGADKVVMASFIHIVRPQASLSATLNKKKSVVVDFQKSQEIERTA